MGNLATFFLRGEKVEKEMRRNNQQKRREAVERS